MQIFPVAQLELRRLTQSPVRWSIVLPPLSKKHHFFLSNADFYRSIR